MMEAFRLPAALDAAPWRCALVAAGLGVISAFALPPFYIVVLLWPGLAGLALLSVTAKTWRRALLYGWLFGVGWFGVGLYWVGEAFLVEADVYGFLAPFAVAGLAAGMAIYPAVGAAVLRKLCDGALFGPLAVVPAFAGLWTIGEWLRGWVLTGFPWNPLASVWGVSLEMLQGAALFGALGLGLVTALVFAAPVLLFVRDQRGYGRPVRRYRMIVLAVSVLLPLFWFGGWWRLHGAGTVTQPDLMLRLVQPAIAQADKWKADQRQGHVIRQMAMSKRNPGPGGAPTHVIWAETNVPFLIGPDAELLSSLAAAVPPGGTLTFGAPRRAPGGDVYNSLFVIDGNGKVKGVFDKFHLVPFGEYVPLRWLLPFGKLVAGRGDFSAGPGPKTLRVDGLPPFSPIICYEVIFSGHVIDPADRPKWILNITNDAWFGPSTGPRQHFQQARLRAIEEGLPVVRVANTGISGVIDAYGRVRNRLDLGEQGVVDAPLPDALPGTPFMFIGQWFALVLAVLALLYGTRDSLVRWMRRAG